MKSTLTHLPQYKQYLLGRITEVIHKSARVEMIILFGSHARGDWVEDRANGYMSDFDILVLVTSADLAADVEPWFDCQERARSVSGETLTCLIVHTVKDVHQKVAQGNSFFRDVLTEGIALYDSGHVELPAITPLTPAQRLTLARIAYPGYFKTSEQSYQAFKDARDSEWYTGATFDLHHTAELIYKAVLLAFEGYQPKTHDLAELDRMNTRAAPALGSLIPRGTPDRKRLARLLSSGYVAARYDPEFTITRDDLNTLAHHVRAFHARAMLACRARLAQLAAIAELAAEVPCHGRAWAHCCCSDNARSGIIAG